jgi:general L-amino acid transport system substrate-binding protein
MRFRVLAILCLGQCLALGLALSGCNQSEAPLPSPEPSAQAGAATQAVGATLHRVRARKRLRCGVADQSPGFAERGLTGQWRGFDVEVCRAIAAAVLGDSRAVSFTPLSSRTRFAALQSGAVDVLAGGATWTFAHDVALGLDFPAVSYYDAQGVLTRTGRKPKTLADLTGAKICVVGGSAAQQGLAEALRTRNMAYQPVVKDKPAEVREAYLRGECDALSDDLSVLAAIRAGLPDSAHHAILAETLADEPLGPVVREGDDNWADIVRWTLNALVLGESMKVTSQNAETLRKTSGDPDVRRLLGVEGETGRRLGLTDEWAYHAIRQVGAYNEIFDRNLGLGTALALERGRNALWNADKPGQLYAPPLR